MTGGGDADEFVFGFDIDFGAHTTYVGPAGDNVITDFDDDQFDLIVMHTSIDADDLSATIVNADQDVLISHTDGWTILLEGLVEEMEGIDPDDIFFDDAALMAFLLEGAPDGTVGANDKGIIEFRDKEVEYFNCEADDAAYCEVPGVGNVDPAHKEMSMMDVGNTTINTNEYEVLNNYLDQDENVYIEGSYVVLDILA